MTVFFLLVVSFLILADLQPREEQKEREQKEGTSRAERTIQIMVEAKQHQNGSE